MSCQMRLVAPQIWMTGDLPWLLMKSTSCFKYGRENSRKASGLTTVHDDMGSEMVGDSPLPMAASA